MTELYLSDFEPFLDRLGSVDEGANALSALLQATVAGSAELLEADVCVIAESQDGGLAPIVTHPPDWTDTDGLLSPESLPSVIASQGSYHLVTDRSAVRDTPDADTPVNDSSLTIESLVVIPFGEERVLVAGARRPSAFTGEDLERLRQYARFGTALYDLVGPTPAHDEPSERLGEAAATLSHDAQNFLTIIQGRAELARDDPGSEHFDAIDRAAERLDELIDDTATLLETGTYATEIEPVSLKQAVNAAWEVEESQHAELVTGAMEPILAERSRLVQLLENLFRNAIEHAGPDVTVWVGALAEDQGFYVADDGPGIEPGERESVLEFAYSGDGESTGLGLSIVRWIAGAHRWDISITESEWGGTRFEFRNVESAS